MGIETTIEYRLPLTKVRLQATVTETVDEIVQPRTLTRTAERTFTLVTMADPGRRRELTVKGGLINDYAFEMAMTEDGRLTSASIESTGHLGQVLTATATLAGAAVALATGNVPLAAMLVTADGGDQPLGATESVAEELTAQQQVWRAYRAAHPSEADRLKDLTAEHNELVNALDTARQRLRRAVGDALKMSREHQAVSTLEGLISDNERELDRANQRFAAWRAGTLKVTNFVHDELVDVVSLPRLADGALQFVDTDEGKLVQTFFNNALGIVATDEDPPSTNATPDPANTVTDRLHLLKPRRVTLIHVEGNGESPTRVSTERVLVMDRACEVMSIPVRKSWSGRRQTGVTLSESGALTKLTYGGTASADAVAQSLAGLPAAFGGALESVATSRAKLDGLRDAPQERELAALKRAVDLEEQRLRQAGQTATTTDYAELQRLKQQKEIAELRAELAKLRAV
ncbi:hypothetical protein GCM10009789_36630 [Kribbella sancticallisti]|uniref:Uncharacterized protein n=1 Tax=Kribbella sancticallisti TaxID=460087 RepID=A0ABN2DPH4_9ACTN